LGIYFTDIVANNTSSSSLDEGNYGKKGNLKMHSARLFKEESIYSFE